MLRYLLAMTLGTLLLVGGIFFAWPAEARPADGMISVENQRFEAVEIIVDGRELGDVRAESRRELPVSAGTHSVRVRTRDGRVVLAQTLRVRPHGAAELRIPPTQANLTVRNATGRDGRLVVEGMDRGSLQPGAERTVVLDPGTVSVQLRDGQFVLDSARLTVRAGERPSWRAAAPTVADLEVRNPLPVPVRVRVDERPTVSLEPGERQIFRGLSPGLTSVVVSERSGRVLVRDEVRVDPYDGGNFVVPPPSEGAIRLVNLGAGTVDVYAGGRRVASIAPRGEEEVMVPLGEVELTLRDRSRDLVLRTTVRVEPFEEVTLRCDLRRYYVTQEHRLVAELEELIAALRRLAS